LEGSITPKAEVAGHKLPTPFLFQLAGAPKFFSSSSSSSSSFILTNLVSHSALLLLPQSSINNKPIQIEVETNLIFLHDFHACL